jgi:transposase-like protein
MGKRSGQTQRRYTPELRERAVRMVREAIAQNNNRSHGVLTRISVDLGVGSRAMAATPAINRAKWWYSAALTGTL